MSIARRSWSLQPPYPVRVDRNNTFGARTQFFSSDLGPLLDAARAVRPQVSGVTRALGQPGVMARLVAVAGASPNYAEFSSAGIDMSRPFTICIKMMRTAPGSGKYDRVFHSFGDLTTNSRWGFLITGLGDGGGGDKLYFELTSSGGTTTATYPPATPTSSTTEYETYVLTHDGSNLRMYRNGALAQTTACSTFPAAVLPNPVRYGSDTYASNPDNGAPVSLQFAHIMRGALSLAEVIAYTANPWQTLAPIERRPWLLRTAAAVPSITAVSAENITSTSADYRVSLDYA